VAWHPELGPPARAAFRTGFAACRGGGSPPGTSARGDWERLAAKLVELTKAAPVDPALDAGAGRAAWVAVWLLDAVACSAERREWDQYENALKDASAAVAAGSPESVRTRDRARLTAAIDRDLDRLVALGPAERDVPVDPGESGPFGRLWVGAPPLVIRIAHPSPQTVAGLTHQAESPKLAPVPSIAPPTTIEEGVGSSPLSALRVPTPPLSPEEAVERLGELLAAVRTQHAPYIDEFRNILKALGGHKFNDRAAAMAAVQQSQEARTLLGLVFVLLDSDPEKNGVKVSLLFDNDASYPEGRIRAVRTTPPQKKLYARVVFPSLDVIDASSDT
jgi:hypothetical protein